MSNSTPKTPAKPIEVIDLRQDQNNQIKETDPITNIKLVRIALIKAIQDGEFDPLLQQAFNGNQLSSDEEKNISNAIKKVMQFKYD